ncbi:MAG: hypothetical protein VXZ82_10085 [Planctomycetota bacterium]|nr:hypothetical protein [Planctomycetota bacterium]
MVRIRSDRWYSSDGQRRSGSAVRQQTYGSRRVLSMCFLLALVILLMQQAADPRYVSNTFRALGVPLEGDGTQPNAGSAMVAAPRDVSGGGMSGVLSPDATWQVTLDDLLPRLLQDCSADDMEAFASTWFHLPSRQSQEEKKRRLERLFSSQEATLRSLSSSIESDTSAAKWAEALVRFSKQWSMLKAELLDRAVADTTEPTGAKSDRFGDLDRYLRASLNRFLDLRLVQSLSDGAPWRKEESTAFWRLLARCKAGGGTGDAKSIPRVSTQQLETEAEELKGKTLRFAGSVRRVERVEKGSPEIGLDHYWLVWMRGEDGSSQPVAVYCSDEMAGQWQRRLERDSQDFAEIEVQAVSAKRLPYGSTSGLEIAPTLFATQISTSARTGADGSGASLATGNQPVWKQVQFSLWTGLLGAMIVLIPIWRAWRSSPVFRQKTLSYKTKSKQRQAGTKSSMWLLCFAAGIGAAGNLCFAQEKPAWAKDSSKQQQRLKALELLLNRAFSPQATQQLQWYLQGESETLDSFPNAILSGMQSVEKVGWGVIPADASFPIPTGGVIRRDRLQGFVRLAMPVTLSEEQQSWFFQKDTEKFYRLAVMTEGNQEITWVFAKEIPRLWTVSPSLFQPVEISGLLLKPEARSSEEPSDGAELALKSCFLAEEIVWSLGLSDRDQLKPQVPEVFDRFGRAGFNLTWVDRIAANNQRPLQEEESEAFYSTLRLVSGPDAPLTAKNEVELSTSTPLRMIKEAKDAFGRPLHWRVRLVQGARIKVPAEARATLGQDYYYQFDGFVDIGNKQIGFNVAGQTEVFEREFPVTLVTCSDSQYVPEEELARGTQAWSVGKYAEVEGVFYRMWSYSSDRMEKIREQGRQAAPLVVVSTLRPSKAPVTRRENPGMQWFSYALCMATLAILGTMLFFASQKDRRRFSKMAPLQDRSGSGD